MRVGSYLGYMVIPTPRYQIIREEEDLDKINLRFPVALKVYYQGFYIKQM